MRRHETTSHYPESGRAGTAPTDAGERSSPATQEGSPQTLAQGTHSGRGAVTREELETWKPPSVEPGLPSSAPTAIVDYALALDRMTGSNGAWFLEVERQRFREKSFLWFWRARQACAAE